MTLATLVVIGFIVMVFLIVMATLLSMFLPQILEARRKWKEQSEKFKQEFSAQELIEEITL